MCWLYLSITDGFFWSLMVTTRSVSCSLCGGHAHWLFSLLISKLYRFYTVLFCLCLNKTLVLRFSTLAESRVDLCSSYLCNETYATKENLDLDLSVAWMCSSGQHKLSVLCLVLVTVFQIVLLLLAQTLDQLQGCMRL